MGPTQTPNEVQTQTTTPETKDIQTATIETEDRFTNPDDEPMEGLSDYEKAWNDALPINWEKTNADKVAWDNLLDQLDAIFAKGWRAAGLLNKDWKIKFPENATAMTDILDILSIDRTNIEKQLSSPSNLTKQTVLAILDNAISLDHQEKLFKVADVLIKERSKTALNTLDQYAQFFLDQRDNLKIFYDNKSAQSQIKLMNEDVRTKVNDMKQALKNAIKLTAPLDQIKSLKDTFKGIEEFEASWKAIIGVLKSFTFAVQAQTYAQSLWK